MVSHMLKGLGNIVNYNYLLVSPNLISKHIVPSRLKKKSLLISTISRFNFTLKISSKH